MFINGQPQSLWLFSLKFTLLWALNNSKNINLIKRTTVIYTFKRRRQNITDATNILNIFHIFASYCTNCMHKVNMCEMTSLCRYQWLWSTQGCTYRMKQSNSLVFFRAFYLCHFKKQKCRTFLNCVTICSVASIYVKQQQYIMFFIVTQ